MKPGYALAAGFCLCLMMTSAICSAVLVSARQSEEATEKAILTIVTASHEGGATRADISALASGLGTSMSGVRSDVSDLAIRVDDARGKLDLVLEHATSRRYAALRTVRALGRNPFVLVLGDSIAEGAPLPERICGVPVINLGIGGARVSDFIPIVEDIVAGGPKISAAVVALGLNDAQLRLWTPRKARHFAESYDHLIAMLPANETLLSTITPIDSSQPIAQRFSMTAWAAVDAEIRAIAAKKTITLIDNSARLASADTVDGAHLSRAGYTPWIERTTSAIRAKIGC